MTYNTPYWKRIASTVLEFTSQGLLILSRLLGYASRGIGSFAIRLSVNAWLLKHIPKDYR